MENNLHNTKNDRLEAVLSYALWTGRQNMGKSVEMLSLNGRLEVANILLRSGAEKSEVLKFFER